MLLLVLTVLVTASSVYSLRSKRGLPLANQILGWVSLGENALSPSLSPVHASTSALQTPFLPSTFRSIRLALPVRIPNKTQEPVLEDPFILPRVLGLFRHTFYQR